ncbi:MAG: SufD family Fe-S cluster assembly protein [Spirochaetes bacterium]|nr:SufD family Fe-S cluster assembly protein [Spirochaetota bacterium]
MKSDTLKQLRLSYLKRAQELSFPDCNDENWKYTKLKNYLDIKEAVLQGSEAADNKEGLEVHGNGVSYRIYSMEEAAEKGFLKALPAEGEVLRYSPDALVRALFTRGLYVKVNGRDNSIGREAEPGSVLHITLKNLLKDKAEEYLFYWIIIEIEAGSELVLLEETENIHKCFGEIDIFAGENSKLHYVSIDDTESGGFHRKRRIITAAEGAEINTHTAAMGGGDFREELEFIANEPGVKAELNKAYIGEGNSNKDFVTLQLHKSREVYSNLLILGALGDTSSGNFTGTIYIERDAQKADAYQLSRTLLFSKDAHARAVPRLEILADDVKCTHGASLGGVDKEDLFYLMSRGISESDAKVMAAQGFFGKFIDSVPDTEAGQIIRDRFHKSLARICR